MKRLSIIRDEQGAMFAEAVITLPAFILVWTLILFVRNGYENAANASRSVRQQSWTHSLSYCDGGVDDDVDDSSRAIAPIAGTVLAASSILPEVSTLVRYQPLMLTRFNKLRFGISGNDYQKEGTISRPAVLGGDAAYGHSLMSLACDEEPDGLSRSLIEWPAWVGIAWLRVRGEL
ncbi:MAG: hypothetical protein AAGF12_23945 [Myxococcota bacterium]